MSDVDADVLTGVTRGRVRHHLRSGNLPVALFAADCGARQIDGVTGRFDSPEAFAASTCDPVEFPDVGEGSARRVEAVRALARRELEVDVDA